MPGGEEQEGDSSGCEAADGEEQECDNSACEVADAEEQEGDSFATTSRSVATDSSVLSLLSHHRTQRLLPRVRESKACLLCLFLSRMVRSRRCRLVVLAIEVGGWWSPEAALARARSRPSRSPPPGLGLPSSPLMRKEPLTRCFALPCCGACSLSLVPMVACLSCVSSTPPGRSLCGMTLMAPHAVFQAAGGEQGDPLMPRFTLSAKGPPLRRSRNLCA